MHLTPDEVLAILVDQHRLQSQVDPEAEQDAVLTFDSSIADWRFACDLVGWRGLARALNEEWGMSLSLREWREILEPHDKRTLRILCETISRKPVIETLPHRTRPLQVSACGMEHAHGFGCHAPPLDSASTISWIVGFARPLFSITAWAGKDQTMPNKAVEATCNSR
jgi:hypothetical protein